MTGSDVSLVDGAGIGLTVAGSVTSLSGVSSVVGANVSVASTGGDLQMSADSGLVVLTNATGLQVSADIKPATDNTINIGDPGAAWTGVYAHTGYFSSVQGVSSISGTNINISAIPGELSLYSDTGYVVLAGGVGLQTSGDIRVDIDNVRNLGGAGNAWAGVWATAGNFTTLASVSTLNAITLTDHDIGNVGQIQIQDGITLDGAGTITLNGSSGTEGQFIGIPIGSSYPEWVSAVPGGGVTSINTLAGDITLTAGTNVSFDTVDNNITINATVPVPPSPTELVNGSASVVVASDGSISLTTATGIATITIPDVGLFITDTGLFFNGVLVAGVA
jgi:hypothetical protein